MNGRIQKDPLFLITPETAKIEIGGESVEQQTFRAILLNKPRGVITTRSDEKGRPTVYTLLTDVTTYLSPVGRLDWATSGLLILTNSTRLASWLTDPRNQVIRTYVVTVRGEVTDKGIQSLEAGFDDEGETLQAHQVILRKVSAKESHLTVQLTEGKNREIRRMFKSLGHEVTRLKRISYGGLELGELESGKYRELTLDEIRTAFPQAPIH